MSELTPCNLCTLNRIRRQAKEEGKRVVLRRSKFHVWHNGSEVFALKDGEEPSENNKEGWFAEIPDRCVC